MPFAKFTVIAIFTALFAGAVDAQSLKDAEEVAEFPPRSYSGKQYVDSRGCVYVRAGVGDSITWVPRVTRQRKVVCGYKPTFAQKPAQNLPVVAAPSKVAGVRPRAKTIAAPMETVAVITTPPKIRSQTATAVSAPKPSASSAQSLRQMATAACARNPGRVKIRINSGGKRYAVQCPGVAKMTAVKTALSVATAAPVSSGAVPSLAKIVVPKGYKAAWSDDRLNPRRAKGTPTGRAQMNLVWSQTVPRRLVTRPPQSDAALQVAHLQSIHTSGVQVSSKSVDSDPRPVKLAGMSGKPASAPRAMAAGYRFVQVGTFGVPGNARATVAKLQRLGLPVRIGKTGRGAKELQIVLAGPFSSRVELDQARSTARKAGFGDAFLVK